MYTTGRFTRIIEWRTTAASRVAWLLNDHAVCLFRSRRTDLGGYGGMGAAGGDLGALPVPLLGTQAAMVRVLHWGTCLVLAGNLDRVSADADPNPGSRTS